MFWITNEGSEWLSCNFDASGLSFLQMVRACREYFFKTKTSAMDLQRGWQINGEDVFLTFYIESENKALNNYVFRYL